MDGRRAGDRVCALDGDVDVRRVRIAAIAPTPMCPDAIDQSHDVARPRGASRVRDAPPPRSRVVRLHPREARRRRGTSLPASDRRAPPRVLVILRDDGPAAVSERLGPYRSRSAARIPLRIASPFVVSDSAIERQQVDQHRRNDVRRDDTHRRDQREQRRRVALDHASHDSPRRCERRSPRRFRSRPDPARSRQRAPRRASRRRSPARRSRRRGRRRDRPPESRACSKRTTPRVVACSPVPNAMPGSMTIVVVRVEIVGEPGRYDRQRGRASARESPCFHCSDQSTSGKRLRFDARTAHQPRAPHRAARPPSPDRGTCVMSASFVS